MNEPLRARGTHRERRGHLDAAPDPGGDRGGTRPQRADETQPLRGGAAGRRLPPDAVPLVRRQGRAAQRVRRLRARDVRHRHRQGDRGPAGNGKARRRPEVHRGVPALLFGRAACRHRARGRHHAAVVDHPGHACAAAEADAGSNGGVKAATAIRVAVSHYIVRSDDDDQFLAQLRHAIGIKPTG